MTAYTFAAILGYHSDTTPDFIRYSRALAWLIKRWRPEYLVPIGAPGGVKGGEAALLARTLGCYASEWKPKIRPDDNSYTTLENIRRLAFILEDEIPPEDWCDINISVKVVIYCEWNRRHKVRLMASLLIDSRVKVHVQGVRFEHGLVPWLIQMALTPIELASIRLKALDDLYHRFGVWRVSRRSNVRSSAKEVLSP